MATGGHPLPLDQVDIFLDGQDGLIERPKSTMCLHGKKSKCSHCLALDPYDEGYLAEKDIKHLSFHSYLRKRINMDKKGKSSKIKYFLENIVCRVKPNCKNHPPYPAAVCANCQPDPVTLNRQPYRHVDNISFENELLVNRFLDFWRRTGHQRVGFLIGRYEAYAEVPLGIRATVLAIYEPPQWSTACSVQLTEDQQSDMVDRLCTELGLKKIGWIFTDLSTEEGSGTVKCSRDVESYILSAEECVTAGHFQNLYLNPCKYSPDGYFGSKFVTVVATGDQHSSNIHFSGYQVSNQCAALVKDDWLVPVRNTPELAFVRDDKRCVPDVKYMVKDQYGNQVTKDGRPLPIEYLLVDVPAGMPKEPSYTLNSDCPNRQGFKIENRDALGELQNLDTLREYCNQFGSEEILTMFSDFHFLLFLRGNTIHAIEEEKLKPLLNALRDGDEERVKEWQKSSPDWATLTYLMDAGGNGARGREEGTGNNVLEDGTGMRMDDEIQEIPVDRNNWACTHCTFQNMANSRDCEMCGLPRT